MKEQEELTLQQRAENYMYAKVQAATNELKDAERWDGRGWSGVEDWKEVKLNGIAYAKRRVEVAQYILTKLYD
jgi:hypothetical protein